MPERASLLALAVGFAAGAAAAGGAPGAVTSERARALEHLVRQDCGSCHGFALSGGLGPDIRGPALAGIDTGTLAAVILDGRAGTAMPPWRPLLREEEILWIVTYLRGVEAE